MAISVNMLRLRFTTDCQPRTKNGQPAHSTTGRRRAASGSSSRSAPPGTPGRARSGGRPSRARAPAASARARSRTGASCRRARDWARLGRDEHRLQGHAADRAGARADLPDLGMHRAGVDLGQGAAPSRASASEPSHSGKVNPVVGSGLRRLPGSWPCTRDPPKSRNDLPDGCLTLPSWKVQDPLRRPRHRSSPAPCISFISRI